MSARRPALRLRPLSASELTEFLPRLDDAYRRQLVELAGMPEYEAREKAARDHASLFPGGRVADRHLALAAEDEGGRVVGQIVYALRADGRAWLYWIEVDESIRGRGYGRETLRLFEEHARAAGAHEAGLNVFAANAAARHLYRTSGWREQSVWMGKPLA